MVGRLLRLRRARVAAALAMALVHLCSVGPAAASLIYCIGQDGHQGIELVRHGDRGCASCCHESPTTQEHRTEASSDRRLADADECTDVQLEAASAFQGRHPAPSIDETAIPLPRWESPASRSLRDRGVTAGPAHPPPQLASLRVVVLLL